MLTNILGTFAALFLAVSAYFAWENKKQYEEQIATLNFEIGERDAARVKLKKTQGEVAIAKDDLAESEATLATAEEDLDAQENVVADLQSQIEDQKLTLVDVQDSLKEAEEATAGVGSPEELLADVIRFKIEIAELGAEIASAETQRASLDNTSESLVSQINTTRSTIGLYTKQVSNPTLNTSISNVYGGFGFVTIKGGDSAGIIKGSTLRVVRGNDTVAKLLVTAVEKNQAAANIVPNSLAPDTSVYPGDKVIAEIN